MTKRKTIFSEEKSLKWVARLLALMMLCLAVYLLIRGDSTGGAVAGALAFGLLAYQFFPLVHRLEIFGLKAELREKIDEADNALSNLRTVAAELARANALQTAWSGRWSQPPRELIDSNIEGIDRILAHLQVSSEERYEIKKPYLTMAGLDLFNIIAQVVAELVTEYGIAASNKFAEYKQSATLGQRDDLEDRLSTQAAAYNRDQLPTVKLGQLDKYPADMIEAFKEMPVAEEDRKRINDLIHEIDTLYREMHKQRRIPKDALELLNEHDRDHRRKFVDLFGDKYAPALPN